MANNFVSIACPICNAGNTTTHTETVTKTTTIPPSGNPSNPTTTDSDSTVTTSSTSIQHTYDLTGYSIPIEVEGVAQGNLPPHKPIKVEGLVQESPSPQLPTHPKRAIHAIQVVGISNFSAKRNQDKGTEKDPLGQPITLVFACPIKQEEFQAILVRRAKDGPIEALEVEALSPDNSALLDVGKQIATDALKVSSSFCTTMIGVSTTAIGVYTGLFALVVPKSCSYGVLTGFIAIVPALVFIAAAVNFAYGAFPVSGSFMIADPQSIEAFRENLFRIRRTRLMIGFGLFCLAMALAVLAVILVSAQVGFSCPASNPVPTLPITPTP